MTRPWLLTAARRVAAHLPPPFLRAARRWHYPRRVARFAETDWPPAGGARALVRPGSAAVDAGANIGCITALLSRWAGPGGRVFSFEPAPETFDLLERAVRRLALTNVETIRAALSDQPGFAELRVPAGREGIENLYEATLEGLPNDARPARAIRVRTVRLDDVVNRWAGEISFIKIDVEGHEEKVLRGGLETLRRHRPALLIEIDGNLDDPSSSAGRVCQTLGQMGYRPYFWRGEWTPRRPGESAVDYFFLLPHHVRA